MSTNTRATISEMGATQLKFMQSGGVVSAFDPWQLLAGSKEEIEAAVQVAGEYGS